MRVTFASLAAGEPIAFGIMSLAGALRAAGHTVQAIEAPDVASLAQHPAIASADVIGFSATTGLHRLYVRWAHALRARFPNKALVMGGPHPTFFPDVLETAPLDGICLGEGEESFPAFLEAYAAGFPEVPDGFHIRRDGGRGPIERGRPRGPVQNLDSLPPAAYDLFYDRDRRGASLPIRVFLPTRGCPFRCRYCLNPVLLHQHRAFGVTLRSHDPERVADEILYVMRRWGGRLVWFLDANLPAHAKWLRAFLPVYKRRVCLPFFCKLRPEQATRDTVRRLAEAGCTGVGVGIECGSEALRRTVLGRAVSDAQILSGVSELKRHGIRVMSFNMLGIPGETFEDALRTVALNAAAGVDYGGATLLQPYPGTALSDWAIAQGYFDGNFENVSYSYFAPSPLAFPSARERDRFTNLQRLFALAVEFPEVRRVLHRLVDRPPSVFYRYLFEARHHFALRVQFHRAFRPQDVVERPRGNVYAEAARELGLSDRPPGEVRPEA